MKIKVFFQHSVKLPVVVDCQDSGSKMDYQTIESKSEIYELTLTEIQNYFAKLNFIPNGFYHYGFADEMDIATYPYRTLEEIKSAVKSYSEKRGCEIFEVFFKDNKIVFRPPSMYYTIDKCICVGLKKKECPIKKGEEYFVIKSNKK